MLQLRSHQWAIYQTRTWPLVPRHGFNLRFFRSGSTAHHHVTCAPNRDTSSMVDQRHFKSHDAGPIVSLCFLSDRLSQLECVSRSYRSNELPICVGETKTRSSSHRQWGIESHGKGNSQQRRRDSLLEVGFFRVLSVRV